MAPVHTRSSSMTGSDSVVPTLTVIVLEDSANTIPHFVVSVKDYPSPSAFDYYGCAEKLGLYAHFLWFHQEAVLDTDILHL